MPSSNLNQESLKAWFGFYEYVLKESLNLSAKDTHVTKMVTDMTGEEQENNGEKEKRMETSTYNGCYEQLAALKGGGGVMIFNWNITQVGIEIGGIMY